VFLVLLDVVVVWVFAGIWQYFGVFGISRGVWVGIIRFLGVFALLGRYAIGM